MRTSQIPTPVYAFDGERSSSSVSSESSKEISMPSRSVRFAPTTKEEKPRRARLQRRKMTPGVMAVIARMNPDLELDFEEAKAKAAHSISEEIEIKRRRNDKLERSWASVVRQQEAAEARELDEFQKNLKKSSKAYSWQRPAVEDTLLLENVSTEEDFSVTDVKSPVLSEAPKASSPSSSLKASSASMSASFSSMTISPPSSSSSSSSASSSSAARFFPAIAKSESIRGSPARWLLDRKSRTLEDLGPLDAERHKEALNQLYERVAFYGRRESDCIEHLRRLLTQFVTLANLDEFSQIAWQATIDAFNTAFPVTVRKSDLDAKPSTVKATSESTTKSRPRMLPARESTTVKTKDEKPKTPEPTATGAAESVKPSKRWTRVEQLIDWLHKNTEKCLGLTREQMLDLAKADGLDINRTLLMRAIFSGFKSSLEFKQQVFDFQLYCDDRAQVLSRIRTNSKSSS